MGSKAGKEKTPIKRMSIRAAAGKTWASVPQGQTHLRISRK